ncbi:hypothetical protein D3C80_1841550 [compost metagenome]
MGLGFPLDQPPLVAGDFPFLEEGQLFMHEGLGMASEPFGAEQGAIIGRDYCQALFQQRQWLIGMETDDV